MSAEGRPVSLEELLARLGVVPPVEFAATAYGAACFQNPEDQAASVYAAAIGIHASAEQLAVFWSEFPEAKTHRVAIDFIQKHGIEECIAQPLTPGAW